MKIILICLLGLVILANADEKRDKEHERESTREHERKENEKTERAYEQNKKEEAPIGETVVGHWNLTNRYDEICIKLDAGIELIVEYETTNGSKAVSKFHSNDYIAVDDKKSVCRNSTVDREQTLSLDFGRNRDLSFYFTRDHNITGDNKQEKWQLYRIEFNFTYDEGFPNAKKMYKPESLRNAEPLKDIASTFGRSYGCTKMNPIEATDSFTINLKDLRVQAFMTSNDFGQGDWCAQEQTSDLIPIIIGAALAALVIIVLIAYLIGRARARTTSYDNI